MSLDWRRATVIRKKRKYVNVEDKQGPTIACVDAELYCTDPVIAASSDDYQITDKNTITYSSDAPRLDTLFAYDNSCANTYSGQAINGLVVSGVKSTDVLELKYYRNSTTTSLGVVSYTNTLTGKTTYNLGEDFLSSTTLADNKVRGLFTIESIHHLI